MSTTERHNSAGKNNAGQLKRLPSRFIPPEYKAAYKKVRMHLGVAAARADLEKYLKERKS